MRVLFLFAFSLLMIGCRESGGPGPAGAAAPDEWYQSWMNEGQTLHAEFSLKAGDTRKFRIPSAEPLTVGFTLSAGFDIVKSGGTVYLGTPDQPHTAGGAPGVFIDLAPEDGNIDVLVENASGVETRVALYTAVPGR